LALELFQVLLQEQAALLPELELEQEPELVR
jgi:hypothetical protein